MTLDPHPRHRRCGTGQLADGDAPEPVDLLAEAAWQAVGDARSDRLLGAVDSIRVGRSAAMVTPGAKG